MRTIAIMVAFIVAAGIASMLAGCLLSGCSKSDNIVDRHFNSPPVARLANAPVDDPATTPDSARFTKSPLVTLYWVGNDADGFVVAFMYRWSFKDTNSSSIVHYHPWTTILNYVTKTDSRILVPDIEPSQVSVAAPALFKYFSNIDLNPGLHDSSNSSYDPAIAAMFTALGNGDTVMALGYHVHASNPDSNIYPVHTSPNKGTFIFESNDYANRHTFELKAVDNLGAMSRTDSIRIWNGKVEPPRVLITSAPSRSDTVFVLQNATYSWPGIIFKFVATDRNSRTLEYSWRLDGHDWTPFDQCTTAYVTASALDTPYTGSHTFTVRARNEFGAITPPDSQPSVSFSSIYPSFAEPGYRRMLLVQEARPDARNTPPYPETDRITKFYTDIFDSLGLRYDVWLTIDRGQPRATDLAHYSVVYLTPDILPYITSAQRAKMIMNANRYAKYLDVGGNMIFNGINWPIFLQVISDPDSLLVKHMGIRGFTPDRGYLTNRSFDFIGAFGNHQLGYPDVTLDSTKLDSAWRGALQNIAVLQPQGFAEVIFRFKSKSDSTYTDPYTGVVTPFENGPVGLRYLGATFKTVYFGFPLYRIPVDQATAILRKALEDVGQL